MKINLIKVINPIYIILFMYSFQFIIWFFFFKEANNLYLVWKEEYFSLSAISKHLLFIMVLIFSIFFGMSVAYKNARVNKKNTFFNIKINWFIYILIFIFLLGELSIFFTLMKNFSSLLNSLQSHSMTVFTYYFRDHKPVISTLVNIFPLVTILIVFNKHFKNKFFWLFVIGFLLLIQSLFLTARILIVNYIILLSVAYGIKNSIRISLKKIFFFTFVILLVILISELLRSGIIYSMHEHISLFSLKNINFVIHYLLTAYIGSDVNNSMIFYDSNPTLNIVYGTSPFLQNVFNGIAHPYELSLIHPIERDRTMNLLSMLWIGWGYLAIPVIAIIGFFSGYSYVNGVKKKNNYWLVIYLIFFPAILFSLRQNYFVQPFFIYPLFLFFILNLLIKIHYNRRAS